MDQSKTRDERKVFKKRISKIHFLSVSNMGTITNLRMIIVHFHLFGIIFRKIAPICGTMIYGKHIILKKSMKATTFVSTEFFF